MKIVTIVGARPQFIKCAPVSREIRKDHTEILVHTGQHYDPEMSDIFFEELEIPKPDYHLGVGSGNHGKQTGRILEKIEEVLLIEKPDLVLVYGDTNSTLAGALAAAKLHIPVAHVEAGLRSFDRSMPEEINRVVTDHVSVLLFCPTENAVNLLNKEGISNGVYLTGDVMVDALYYNQNLAEKKSRILERLALSPGDYFVLTIHRPSNTDNRDHMVNILDTLSEVDLPVVFPIHPRTKKVLADYNLLSRISQNILLIDPLGYLDMLKLMRHARKILTDSGGIQKEAFIFGIPCITLRENTEWVETLVGGWNTLVGADKEQILVSLKANSPIIQNQNFYSLGNSAVQIARAIHFFFTNEDTSTLE